MGKSGQLRATNDQFIKELLKDSNIRVFRNGRIETKRDKAGWITEKWRVVALKDNNGYKSIGYETSAGRKRLSVHRIVFAKFCGNLDSEMVINHKDGDPSNNEASNLELITQSENNTHRFQVLGHIAVKGNSKITQEIADQLRLEHEKGSSYNDLVKKYGFSKSTIGGAIRGLTWNDSKKTVSNFATNKIDFTTAEKIRQERIGGKAYMEIAEKYDLGKTTVINICQGKTYKRP